MSDYITFSILNHTLLAAAESAYYVTFLPYYTTSSHYHPIPRPPNYQRSDHSDDVLHVLDALPSLEEPFVTHSHILRIDGALKRLIHPFSLWIFGLTSAREL